MCSWEKHSSEPLFYLLWTHSWTWNKLLYILNRADTTSLQHASLWTKKVSGNEHQYQVHPRKYKIQSKPILILINIHKGCVRKLTLIKNSRSKCRYRSFFNWSHNFLTSSKALLQVCKNKPSRDGVALANLSKSAESTCKKKLHFSEYKHSLKHKITWREIQFYRSRPTQIQLECRTTLIFAEKFASGTYSFFYFQLINFNCLVLVNLWIIGRFHTLNMQL